MSANFSWLTYLPSFIQKRVEGRQNLQKIIGNTGWLFFDKGLRLGMGLLVSAWMARYLGPELFGTYNYALAFVMIFSTLANLGLDGIVVRDIVRDPACMDETLGSAFVLKFIAGILTLLVTSASIALLRPNDTLIFWMVTITAAGTVFQAFDTIDFWFQSQVCSKNVVYVRSVAFLLISFVKIALILAHAPLVAFALAGLGEVAIAAVGLVIAYKRNGRYLRDWSASIPRVKKLLEDSWPLILGGLFLSIHARIDQVMLGQMISQQEVGYFSAATKLIDVLGFVPVIIYSSVAPEITNAKVQGEQIYFDKLAHVYRVMTILFLVTAVPVLLVADWLVVFLYGSEYQAAGKLLCLYVIRLFFTNIGMGKALFITNENLFRYAMLTALIGSISNIGLNYLWIPTYMSVGVIWAMIVSFAVSTFAVDIFFSRTRNHLKVMIKAILTPWQVRI
ncbi:MAG: flippase [Desulfuromonadaceae bacterium]